MIEIETNSPITFCKSSIHTSLRNFSKDKSQPSIIRFSLPVHKENINKFQGVSRIEFEYINSDELIIREVREQEQPYDIISIVEGNIDVLEYSYLLDVLPVELLLSRENQDKEYSTKLLYYIKHLLEEKKIIPKIVDISDLPFPTNPYDTNTNDDIYKFITTNYYESPLVRKDNIREHTEWIMNNINSGGNFSIRINDKTKKLNISEYDVVINSSKWFGSGGWNVIRYVPYIIDNLIEGNIVILPESFLQSFHHLSRIYILNYLMRFVKNNLIIMGNDYIMDDIMSNSVGISSYMGKFIESPVK